MSLDYAAAGDLLAMFGHAWEGFDGDGMVALFGDDGEYQADPFEPPLVGHNALRALLLRGASTKRDLEFTIQRHWVSGDTVLAAWHASYLERPADAPARQAGFMTLEMAADGRIARLREWVVRSSTTSG